MVEDIYRRERFWFRFLKLSDLDVKKLRRLMPTVPLIIRHKGDGSVVSLEITEPTDFGPLYSFLDGASLDPSSYSVWISVVTSSDHGGVSVPEHVRELIRRTNAGIDFSFTAALGDS